MPACGHDLTDAADTDRHRHSQRDLEARLDRLVMAPRAALRLTGATNAPVLGYHPVVTTDGCPCFELLASLRASLATPASSLGPAPETALRPVRVTFLRKSPGKWPLPHLALARNDSRSGRIDRPCPW